MDFYYLIYKSLPVLWWIAIWGLADIFIQKFVNKKNNLIFFYVTMIAVILGVLYFDEKAHNHF